jgi:Flp pilus assembly protein TadG
MISPHSRSRAVGRRANRRGMAAVELAFLLPMLVFASMAAIDFGRVAYVQIALQNCARNGALYEFYKAAGYQMPSGWTSLSAAVQADAGNLTVTVPSTYGGSANPYSPQSSSNNYVTVTAQCTFTLIALGADGSLPSINHTVTLTQSASMPMPASAATVN